MSRKTFTNNVYTYIQEQKGSSKRETLVWRDKFIFLETLYNLVFSLLIYSLLAPFFPFILFIYFLLKSFYVIMYKLMKRNKVV